MDDRDPKIPKPGLPNLPFLPPGMAKPNLPPPLPRPGAQPPFPAPGLPVPAPSFAAPVYAAPAPRDNSAETARMQEEKERLEKKIAEMEKVVSQEKEKALVAALKSQQDEALSSRVESSLKDIQEKMRRDRRDSQVEEERISLKGKIKELEARLAQERETWMTTLKNQLAERETQGRDVEGHFVYRLQEMERRWLDEKGQWQKALAEREEVIRSLRSGAERMNELKEEFRELSLDKAMAEKEINKLRDDVARSERERASVDAYIKMMPEKEREIAEARAEAAVLRMREEKFKDEFKHREEQLLSEIKFREEKLLTDVKRREEDVQKELGRLQAELGAISDKKNIEKNEEIQKLQERMQEEMQEKDRTLADLAGEKMRAISELLKVKGFVSRVQAVNAAMDKERGQLRLEKMQLAQTMAAQMEDLKRFKMESEAGRAAVQVEVEKARNEHGAQLARLHQEELARLNAAHQSDLARMTAQVQSDFENKTFQLRAKYDAASEEAKIAVRRQLEDDYSRQIKELKVALMSAEGARTSAEQENRKLFTQQKELSDKLSAQQREFSDKLSAQQREFSDSAARLEAERKKLEAGAATLAAQKAEAEKQAREFSAEQAGMREKLSSLSARKAALEGEVEQLGANLRTESENRARFESEMLFLKQKIQQMELHDRETADAFEAERAGFEAQQIAAREQQARDAAAQAELNSKLESYKALEKSFADRLKWALKGSPKE
ncbi:MAG TPA: hypothetical protein PKI19_09660 [Elusimicrobiales bacterium]|nr:hypothetical protein [Elusimicrobiales bacterium]